MAGAGARTRKSGAPSARVGSVEVLRPRQIGPTIPSMRALKGDYAAAAGARGAERRTLEARAESGRKARAALLTARGGEKRGLAAAEASAPKLNMANALGVTAEQHYSSLSSQRANWYAERMKATDPIKRATITGLIKQYDAAMPGAHKAMMAEAAVKAAKPREPGLEHFVARRAAAKAREAEAPKAANPFHEAGLKGPMREASGPHDHEGAGRSRYWDTPTAQRAAMMPAMVKQAGQPFTPEQDRRFAKGWLAEHSRVQQASRKAAAVTPQKGATPATLLAQVKAMPAGKPAAERGESPRRIAKEQAKVIRETSATIAAVAPVVAGARAAQAEHAAAGAAVKALPHDAPMAEKKAVVARWNAAKAGLKEQGARVEAALGAKPAADFNTARRTAKAAEKTAEGLRGELRAARSKGNGEAVTILAARTRAAEAHAAETKAKALAMVGPMAPMAKTTLRAATHLTSEKNEYTGAQFHRVIHGPTGKGVPYMAFGRKDQGERAAAGTKSGKTIDRLINGTTEQKLRAGEAMRRYGRIIDGTKHHDTERHDYHRALAARKTKAAEAERMAKAEARRERREAPKRSVPEATANKARALGATSVRGGKVAFHTNAWERHNEFKSHLEKEGIPFRVKHTGTFVLG